MTSSTQTKPTPQSVLLVFGKPTSADLPQASWFHIEDRARVIASAQSLKFSVLDIQTAEDSSLLDGVHEGVLKGTGRMIVGSVTPEAYKRIDEHAAKTNDALILQAPNVAAAGPKSTSEQRMNNEENNKPLSMASDPWDGLRVGSHVVAKHWYDDGAANGWWLGVITAIEGNDFIIRWPDEPKTLPLKIERKHVAILNPAFDVDREWDRKR